jgi:stress response protein YsnF
MTRDIGDSVDSRDTRHAAGGNAQGFADVLLRPFEAGTMRIALWGEELVARPEAVMTEEVVILKERTVERQELTETLRRWDVVPREGLTGDGRPDAAGARDARRAAA